MALFSPVQGRDCDRVLADVQLREADADKESDVCRVARVHRLPLADWALLGRAEQQLLGRLFIFAEVGKGTIAELAVLGASRRSNFAHPELVDTLRTAGAQQYRHYRILAALNRRLDVDAESAIRSQAVHLLRYIFDRASPEDLPEGRPPTIPALVAIGSVLVDVLMDTTFYGADQILERNDALPELADLAGDVHDEDREARDWRRTCLTRFRRRDPATRQVVASTLDRAVLPCLKTIRTAQEHFDVVQMGLVPDEFVARALDRFFALNEPPDAPSLSGLELI